VTDIALSHDFDYFLAIVHSLHYVNLYHPSILTAAYSAEKDANITDHHQNVNRFRKY
jgi:hypothetical protein